MIKTLTLISSLFLGEYPEFLKWMTCEQRMNELNKRETICAKIEFAEKCLPRTSKNDIDRCFYGFYSELYEITKHDIDVYCGTDGTYLTNDSTRTADFTSWKKGCGCLE